MSSIHSSPRGSDRNHSLHNRERGFALLITITLLAFLVLLLVSLATLTRVETQVASNNQNIAQARQNALMGLNIAVGQLQKYAGPDARVSNYAGSADTSVSNPWFTAVWDANTNTNVPLAWLVSGNETEAQINQATSLNRTAANPEVPLSIDSSGLATNGPDKTSRNTVKLVGDGSAVATGSALDNGTIIVPGVPINAIPVGATTQKTIGRYAFWVGDQGVKASLALPDKSAGVNYLPWAASPTDTQAERIRQQIATRPSYFRALSSEKTGFDPLLDANADVMGKVLSGDQLPMLTPVDTAATLTDFKKKYFHDVTAQTMSVLANTLPDSSANRGLLQDLSVKPNLLGAAFEAYSNYSTYMEAPSSSNTAVPPIKTLSSERRRYTVTPPVVTPATGDVPAMDFSVAPVLNSFLLQFRILRSGGNVQVNSRMFTELWNPDTAAFVPRDLTMEIKGLPTVRVTDPSSGGGMVTVNLQNVPTSLSSGPAGSMTVRLPFTVTAQTDKASWLPGRIYAWVTGTGTPTADLNFYNKSMSTSGWLYTSQVMAGSSASLQAEVSTATEITVILKSGTTVLATYTSPSYPPFFISNMNAPTADGNWKFAFGFRLKQPSSTNKDREWLNTVGGDIRNSAPPSSVFTAFNEALDIDPDAYVNTPATSSGLANFLLYRAMGTALASTRSANNDAPVFELPRVPNLSLGELQHLRLTALRPFSVGNPWGGAVNGWFDKFFFSGVSATATAPDLSTGAPLPNWNMYVRDTRADRTTSFTLDKFRDGGDAHTSRFIMQAGGFNINSTSPVAWRSVLSGLRYSDTRPFKRAFIGNESIVTNYTGSQTLDSVTTLPVVTSEKLPDSTLNSVDQVGGPSFSRFPQSAQETYYWADGTSDGLLSKQAFRQGVRGGNQAISGSAIHEFTTTQLETMAQSIVTLVRQKMSASGPFRTMEEFLSRQASFGNKSLLEKVIADSGINPASLTDATPVPNFADPGFASLTLTQADIMTALAPYLRTRSDTFIVRTYGEVINPATAAVEGKAWCEATVQRFTETVSDTDNIVAPSPSGFGRRFKITQFRWLTSPDI